MSSSTKAPGGRRRPTNSYTTKSGNTIKLNRSLTERLRARKDAKARKRAAYLSTLPKNRFKRILYRMHPRRVAKYWFSREGGIMALKIAGIGIVAGFLLIVGVFAYFRKDLPNLTDISGNQMGGSITYYDKTGQVVLWQDSGAIKRQPVESANMSPFVKNATVAIEDKNFYRHGAFDAQGILRASYNDVFNPSGGTQGGSTITQQLVKLNQQWTNNRTITRKVKELILAVEVEREYSKDDILTGYLNIAPYGGVDYGVETASQDYFGTSAKNLTLAQAAMLAAVPKAPSTYSPYSPNFSSVALVTRQRYIIDQMVEQHMVSQSDGDAAKAVDVVAQVHPRQSNGYAGIKAPYFVLAAKDELNAKYGSQTATSAGWKVTTTLDMNLQTLAEQQVQKDLPEVKKQGGDTAAFAAEDVKTGQMVALVGGVDFFDKDHGQYNYARSPIPPGSSFKPYDYVTMLDNTTNSGAGAVLYDNQAPLTGYPCTNKARPKDGGNCLTDYDFRYPGAETIRYALGGSRNVPAVKAMLTVGTTKVITTAQTMGLTSGYKCYSDEQLTKDAPCYGSSAIGDGAYLHLDEHVNGFATLSREGAYIPQTYILKINDSKGKVIDEWKPPKPNQVVRQDAAFIIDDILSDPNASYLPSGRKMHRYKGWNFAVKTGTTNDAKDGLMMSFSTQYAAGVWVGYHNRQVAMTGAMEDMTEPVIQGWMNGAHSNLTPVNWTKPADIKTLPAYVVRSHIGIGSVEPSPSTDLFPSWYIAPKNGSSSQVLDQVSNKLATSCTPDLAKKTDGNANDNAFSADIFVGTSGGGGSSTTATDDVHNCSDVKPSVTLTAPAVCAITCTFQVAATQGTHPLTSDQFPGTVNLYINDQKVDAQNLTASATNNLTFTYTPTASGSMTVKVQAIDSVLYDSSESAVVSMSTTASPPSPGSMLDGNNTRRQKGRNG
jgi:penicillin-binding protein 1A